MEQELKRITNYMDYIIENNRIYLSIHFAGHILDIIDGRVLDALGPYIAHNNPFCRFVRSDPDRHKCCMKNQKNIISELEGKDYIVHTCYTAAKEIAYPIKKDGIVVGFATVSGYKGEGNFHLDDVLWNSALSDEDIPKKLTDALLPPLCFMLEAILPNVDNPEQNELNRIFAYVSENHCTVTLESLAAHFGRSRSYVSHIFKKKTGRSIRAYCNELKLITAERLLCGSEMSVTEIGLESGFEDTSYFVRLFKEKYGIPPYKYKKSYLTSQPRHSIIKTEK